MTTNETLGIIAGEGKMPIYIAREAAQKGIRVVVAALKGNAREEDFRDVAAVSCTLRLGKLGAGIDFFKKHGVQKILMAGRVQHTSIFSNLMPDLRGAKFLASLKSMKPNYLLSRIIEEFQKEGLEFVSSASYLERFMPPKGVLTKRIPTAEEQQAVAFGYKTAKTIAGLDIGLTCVVSQGAVIAVEGMEGTDACIRRAGELYQKSAEKKNVVAVVKVARPNQDNRFDLPVIGKGTLHALKDAGLTLLAFEAEKTLVLDLEEVVKLADENNICLTAI